MKCATCGVDVADDWDNFPPDPAFCSQVCCDLYHFKESSVEVVIGETIHFRGIEITILPSADPTQCRLHVNAPGSTVVKPELEDD